MPVLLGAANVFAAQGMRHRTWFATRAKSQATEPPGLASRDLLH
jgi:hypothetical protein